MRMKNGLIAAIDENSVVENYSEDSDDEIEYQPTNTVRKRPESDFNEDFKFFSTVEEYEKDNWNDLMKYVKRKAKSHTDDKIAKLRLDNQNVNEVDDKDHNDQLLSEDELQDDRVRKKVTTRRRDEFFDTVMPTPMTYDTNVNFYQMNLSRPLLKAIESMKFVYATPIQAAAIPVALLGRDICGCAATGTGKTAAYMLPTLERLLYRPLDGAPPRTRVLVLVPTRELGVQVYQVTKQLAQFTPNVQVALTVGGLDVKVQEAVLRKTPDIVIATPGRLIDHTTNTPTFTLDSIEVLILDEADRMLDEYFAEQMSQIVGQCSLRRQTMLFSATMTDAVEDLATVSLKRPVRLFVDSNREVALNLRQEFVRIRTEGTGDGAAEREVILAALVCRTFRYHCMVFVQTKRQAHRLHILLGLLGVKVAELHGNLTQPQRLDSLGKFRDGRVDVLVATDVAARGLDIVGVQTVINFVMPPTVQHYIHRVGRTARAGRAGISVSLAGEQERKIVKDVVKKARAPVKARTIPTDVLVKYRKRLQDLEPQIEQIQREEYEERLLNKAQNQVNRLENRLMNAGGRQGRQWFQTKEARREEKTKQRLESIVGLQPSNMVATSKNSLKRPEKKAQSNSRIQREIDKAVLVHARYAKKKSKPGKLRTVHEPGLNTKPCKQQQVDKKKQKKRRFSDLWDTSAKNAKRLRYDANRQKKKMSRHK